jgi:hypothetical protein
LVKRFKRILVESFVAAIALGWIFAQAILHFANIFSTPLASWLSRKEYRMVSNVNVSPEFRVSDALPEVARAVALFIVAGLLLRWLYGDTSGSSASATSDLQALPPSEVE